MSDTEVDWQKYINRNVDEVKCVTSQLLLDRSLWAIRDDGRGVSQHKSGDPALGGGALLGRRPEHQEHVLLVAGQDLDHLALNDADLILLHCHVVLGHQHSGYATAAATFTLHHRGGNTTTWEFVSTDIGFIVVTRKQLLKSKRTHSEQFFKLPVGSYV